MKFLSLALISITAFAAEFNGEGLFNYSHQIGMFGYENAEACKADDGEWDVDNGICFFNTADQVEVKLAAENTYNVKVDTVTTNAHTCTFEGTGKVLMGTDKFTILASTESEEWDGDKFVPATCEVTLTYIDGDTVNVVNNGKCTSFCGARADLTIDEAKRVDSDE